MAFRYLRPVGLKKESLSTLVNFDVDLNLWIENKIICETNQNSWTEIMTFKVNGPKYQAPYLV